MSRAAAGGRHLKTQREREVAPRSLPGLIERGSNSPIPNLAVLDTNDPYKYDFGEMYSVHFVGCLATGLGYLTEKTSRPVDNLEKIDIDVTDTKTATKVRIQSKVIHGLESLKNNYEVDNGKGISYKLEGPAYNKLTEKEARAVRIALVLIAPDDPTAWAQQAGKEHLLCRYYAVWCCIQGESKIPDEKSRKIRLLKSNIFDAKALNHLMNAALKGQKP